MFETSSDAAPSRTNFASRPLIVTPKNIPAFTIPDLNSTKVVNVSPSNTAGNLQEQQLSSPTVQRRHSAACSSSQTGELNVEYYPLTRLPSNSQANHSDYSLTSPVKMDEKDGSASSGSHLKVDDLASVYSRRHSWDSRKTSHPKTMPNIKICVSQPVPSRDASKRGSKASIVDVIDTGKSGSTSQARKDADSRRMSINVSNYFESACRNKRSMRRRRRSNSTARALSSVDLSSCGCENSLADLSLSPTDQTSCRLMTRKSSMFDTCHVGKTLSSLLSPFRNGNMIAASQQFCSLQKLSSNCSSQCCSACSSRRSSFNPPSPELGFVEVEALWIKESMKLVVTVLNAWDIDAPYKGKLSPNDLFTYKVSLKGPKQTQKQEGPVFSNLKDPSFGQSFTFYAVTEDLLETCSVKIKFVAKSNSLRRKRNISNCTLKLDSLNNNKVTKFWLALEELIVMKTIGTLSFSLRFTRDGTLQLSNLNARDLAKKVLKSSAETYLTIVFDDKEKTKSSGLGPMVHKTSIAHDSLSPSFQETYSFKFAPRNVHDCSLEISLHQKCKLRSDLLVGQVRLGATSTEVSEFEHWTSVISNPGVTQDQTHFLMEPDVV